MRELSPGCLTALCGEWAGGRFPGWRPQVGMYCWEPRVVWPLPHGTLTGRPGSCVAHEVHWRGPVPEAPSRWVPWCLEASWLTCSRQAGSGGGRRGEPRSVQVAFASQFEGPPASWLPPQTPGPPGSCGTAWPAPSGQGWGRSDPWGAGHGRRGTLGRRGPLPGRRLEGVPPPGM